MTFDKSHIGYFIAFILVGGILGSALGTLAVKYLPAAAFLQQNLTGPVGFNLEIIEFHLRINLSAVIGIILGAVIFRKV